MHNISKFNPIPAAISDNVKRVKNLSRKDLFAAVAMHALILKGVSPFDTL